MNVHSLFKRFAAAQIALLLTATILLTAAPVSAAPSIIINAPTDGQRFTGNDFTISGTTEPNATVVIQKGDTVLAQLLSGSDGAWSTTLSNLPDGDNAITAKVVQSTGYAYFTSTTSLSSVKVNQLRFSDHALNTTSGFPLTSPFGIALLPSPAQDLFYSFPGVFSPSSAPNLIDLSSLSSPQQSTVSGYPTPVAPTKGEFTADGSKYFSPNQHDSSFSVVDVATNTHIQKVTLADNPIYIARGPSGNMYISTEGGEILVVNPVNNQIINTISGTCSGYLVGITFPSQYTSQENFYALCVTASNGELKKFRLSDNELVGSYDIGTRAMTAVLNLDGSKLFIVASALDPEVTEEDKVRVFDTNTNQITDSIQLNGGAVGVLSSPDYQSLYIATPTTSTYMDISVNNIDVLNMSNYSIEQITTPEPPIVINSSPATTTDIADMTIGVVLGVANGAGGAATGDGASNMLAETGFMQVSSILLIGVILSVLLYTYVDFRKHRKPLLEMDSSARYTYTYAHHIKTVTIPLMRYRINVSVKKV